MRKDLPIGVFDSGLGGLTVLKALKARLPGEDFLYLGDVARLPYGTKSRPVVERYVRSCVRFLWDRGVKWVVMACNTATAIALKQLEPDFEVGMSGVIAPGVRAALGASQNKKIVVLGTSATVFSGAYMSEFERQAPDVRVSQIACPLLVPLAEEGWFDKETTDVVIRHYLSAVKDFDYDTILLGCTHYPLLHRAFERTVGSSVSLVHGGSLLAQELETMLCERNLSNSTERMGQITCFATDEIARARPIMEALFGRQMGFEKVDLDPL